MVTPHERTLLDAELSSLRDWQLGEIKRARDASLKIGTFVLVARFIDTLARRAYSRPTDSQGERAWVEFINRFMPAYAEHAALLYSGYRGRSEHNNSSSGVRYTDG